MKIKNSIKQTVQINVKAITVLISDSPTFTFIIFVIETFFIFLTFFSPDISIQINQFLKDNQLFSIIIFIILILLIFYCFHIWKKNNFYLVKSKVECKLLIEGENGKFLSIIVPNILLSLDDITLFKLTLEFKEGLIFKLKHKKEYTLVFDKPHSLEVEPKPSNGINFDIIDDGLEKNLYCVVVNFRNVNKEAILFKVEGDYVEGGKIGLFFYEGRMTNLKDFGPNKKPLFKSSICFKDWKISQGNDIRIIR